MGLVILKHLSNPDPKHRNNFWGLIDLMAERKEHRLSFRPTQIMKDHIQLPFWFHEERIDLWKKAQEAANTQQLRRKKRFDAHVQVLQDFVETMGMPCMHSFIQVREYVFLNHDT